MAIDGMLRGVKDASECKIGDHSSATSAVRKLGEGNPWIIPRLDVYLHLIMFINRRFYLN